MTLKRNRPQLSKSAKLLDYPTGGSPWAVAVADFNTDGKADLVTANENVRKVSILLGRGDGTFRSHVEYGVGGNPIETAKWTHQARPINQKVQP